MSRFLRSGPATVFSGRFDVVDYEVTAPDGSRSVRQIVRHPGAVTVVAHEAGEVVLVHQYRASVDRELWELPAGKLDPDEAPEVCARRELVEEVGLHPGRLEPLTDFWVSPGFCDERMWVYLAEDLAPRPANPQGAEEAHMEVARVALGEAVTMVGDGRIRDAKSMLGVLLAMRHLENR